MIRKTQKKREHCGDLKPGIGKPRRKEKHCKVLHSPENTLKQVRGAHLFERIPYYYESLQNWMCITAYLSRGGEANRTTNSQMASRGDRLSEQVELSCNY